MAPLAGPSAPSVRKGAFNVTAAAAVPGPLLRKSVATTATAVAVLERTAVQTASAPVSVEALNKKLAARSKALIALEEQEIATRPLTKVALQREIGLGEVWRVCGALPELGRMTPEVAPSMTWGPGHVWTWTGRVRAGTHAFKVVLCKPNGHYIWEAGPDRLMQVPQGLSPEDVVDVTLAEVKLPAAY